MIEGVSIRELRSSLDAAGFSVEIWEDENLPGSRGAASCRVVFPGSVEAWFGRDRAAERIICLQGMIKLVLCDRREGSLTREEVMEVFLGEYRFREAIVPPGVLRGWKAVGGRAALVLLVLEGEGGGSSILEPEDAGVPYDWDIVMQ